MSPHACFHFANKQSLLKEGQKRSAQYEVLGKPVYHIGLNWQELQEISLPSPSLESFQIIQTSQDSAAWLGSWWDGEFVGSWTSPVSRLTRGLRSVTHPRHLAAASAPAAEHRSWAGGGCVRDPKEKSAGPAC